MPRTADQIRAEIARLRRERDAMPCDGSGRFPAADEWAEQLDAEIYELGIDLAEIEDAEAETNEEKRAA